MSGNNGKQQVKETPVTEQNTNAPEAASGSDIVGTHISFDVSDPVGTMQVVKEVAQPVLYAPKSEQSAEPSVADAVPLVKAQAPVAAAPTPVAVSSAKPLDFSENPFKSVGAKIAYEELKHYVEAMLNKKVALTLQQGAVVQASLYRALVAAINAPAEESKDVMDFFLAVIEKHLDTVFAPHSVFRFVNGMNLPKAAQMHFRHLTNMFVALAPVKSRRLAIKQSGLPNVLNNRLITEEGRQRALSYFGL